LHGNNKPNNTGKSKSEEIISCMCGLYKVVFIYNGSDQCAQLLILLKHVSIAHGTNTKLA